MEYEELISVRDSGDIPGSLSPLLQALLLDAAGDWDGAHSIAQDVPTADGSWVHAYLHRKEGDRWNANYWYSRAGKTMPDYTLAEEWEILARTLTKK